MRSKSILVIDDDPSLPRILKRALEDEGYAVATAENVVELLRNTPNHVPDLILLDIMMPWMSGFTACRKLKERFNGCPVIMMSGLSRQQDIERGLGAGADAYLTKPFDMDALAERIAQLLNTQTRPLRHETEH